MKGSYSSYLRLACLELERMLLLRNGRILDRINHVSDQSDQARTVRTAVCGLNECAPCACSQQEKPRPNHCSRHTSTILCWHVALTFSHVKFNHES